MALIKQDKNDCQVKNICCIGAGYVGGTISSVIAYTNASLTLNVVDLNEGRIDAWNSRSLPITEPGLLELVRVARDGTDGREPNLFFSTSIERAIRLADVIFIAVNTPTTSTGALATTEVEVAVEAIARMSTSNKLVVVKSTVLPGTSRKMSGILTRLGRPGIRFDILSNPEFLAEGTAIQNLLYPDRILIGSEQDEQGLQAMKALRQIYMGWVPEGRIIAMNIQSAELAKLAANVLLAQRLSSINALSVICEEIGADVEEVALACGLDARIGSGMLKASLGFGGSCLKKDVLAMAHVSDMLDLDKVGSYWRSIVEINEHRKSRFAERIVARLNNTITGKRVAILVAAFKKGTGDVRESPAIDLIAMLMREGAQVSLYDPQVKGADLVESLAQVSGQTVVALLPSLEVCESAYAACNNAHAVVVATDWDEFSNRGTNKGAENHGRMQSEQEKAAAQVAGIPTALDSEGNRGAAMTLDALASSGDEAYSAGVDWAKISDGMNDPKLVFDGRNVIDGPKLTALGFEVEPTGKHSSP